MKYLIIALMLSSCSLLPTIPKQVNIPVRVACIKETPQKPELLFGEADKDKPIVFQIQDMAIDRLNMLSYEAELEAVVEGCK